METLPIHDDDEPDDGVHTDALRRAVSHRPAIGPSLACPLLLVATIIPPAW